jgi:hypothetical protein
MVWSVHPLGLGEKLISGQKCEMRNWGSAKNYQREFAGDCEGKWNDGQGTQSFSIRLVMEVEDQSSAQRKERSGRGFARMDSSVRATVYFFSLAIFGQRGGGWPWLSL